MPYHREVMNERTEYYVSLEYAGLRLDAFIARHRQCGMRTAKRLIDNSEVLVNGKRKPPLFKLQEGMAVTLACTNTPAKLSGLPKSLLITATNTYAVFFKPSGMHTAHISGGTQNSLELLIRLQWNEWRDSPTPFFAGTRNPATSPILWAPFLDGTSTTTPPSAKNLPLARPMLVNRLDRETSGLVIAAFTKDAAEAFRQMEIRGQITKYYLALVWGEMADKLILRYALDMDSRKKTRVAPKETNDSLRHTIVEPIKIFQPNSDFPAKTTLVAAKIKRGARHQIRTHLAASGFPIVGDDLYGNKTADQHHTATAAPSLMLHHARFVMPGIFAYYDPPWVHVLPDLACSQSW